MSEDWIKLLEDAFALGAEQIKKAIEEELGFLKTRYEERLKDLKESLLAISGIVLPVKVLNILALGGNIEVKLFNVDYDTAHFRVSCYLDGQNLKDLIDRAIPKGRYRLTVILEKLKEEEKP